MTVLRTPHEIVQAGVAHGVVLGVRTGDRVDIEVAGLRGPHGEPLTGDTAFPVASITKPATGALLHVLHERAELNLDERAWRNATWRDLLRHDGGVGPDWGDLAALGNGDDAAAAYAARAAEIEWLGAPWSYGNPGYWLAGAHAGAASGRGFEAAMRALVLEPAGLTGAAMRPWADDPGALAHDQVDPRQSSYLAMPRARMPSGGLRATVRDVLALAAACWPGGALGHLGMLAAAARESAAPDGGTAPREGAAPDGGTAPGESAASHEGAAPRDGAAAGYASAYGGRLWGPGWEEWRAADGTAVAGHSGVSGGFRTRLWSVPSRRTAVAVLAVGGGSPGVSGLETLEDAVLELALEALASATGLREPAPAPGPLRDDLGVYAGVYARRSARHEVSVAGEGLRIRTGGPGTEPGEVLARPLRDDRFVVTGPSAPRRHVEFLRGDDGELAFVRVGLLAAAKL